MNNSSIHNRPDTVDESEVIMQAKHGDQQALSELVNRYSGRIYNLALRILRNKEDAEDVLQETFMTVLKKISTFDERSSFFTWIYRIATNVSLMKLRRKKIAYTEYLDNPDFERGRENAILQDWSQNPALGLDDREVKKILDQAINDLAEIYRTVFVLRDIEDLSIKDAAKILDISEENVKIRLRRARIFLRDRLSEYFSERVLV
jgi:RNA polymerase sigma-70 factor (ECF subfamily)